MIRTVFVCGILCCGAAIAQESGYRMDGIAAVVGDEVILRSEVEAYILLRRRQDDSTLAETDASLRQRYVNELISNKILVMQAKRDTTITVADEDVDREVRQRLSGMLRRSGMTREEFERELMRRQGVSFAEFKRQAGQGIRDELLKQQIQQKHLAGIEVTRNDVEEFFREYRDSLPDFGESVRLSSCVCTVTPSDSVRQRAYAAVLRIKERVEAGESFERLMPRVTLESDGVQGMDLGFIEKGSLSEIAFENAAFSLQPGETSDIFETRLGFHYVTVAAKKGRRVHVRQFHAPLGASPDKIDHVERKCDSLIHARGEADFDEVRALFSDDPLVKTSVRQSGWIELSATTEALRSRIDTLETGRLSRPIRQDNRIALYRVEERAATRRLSIEDDWNILSIKAREIAAQKRLIALVEKWRKEIFVDIRL